ncbi:polyferredoxin [Desulfosporosinus acidiphilus SJ4]|uniref:Polyferredoxin n=1 Tax=Desulfosporosinus acidiphilus (strain DSM 22704 / JCM 16185 / SJ4) TaxID=646529 RepID=I4D600_DESAJ|nr:4Fe-4S binding protein [Desulfosporosinus acidiphilus]AFM41224.1 polyferredoxin [Desulfosporosinus acidiphilus SJ4]
MFSKLKAAISWRHGVQLLFAIMVGYIGIDFLLFINQLTNQSTTFISRPPGVEAFLPLSALVGLRAWLATGIFDSVHPAGLVIFLLIVLTSLLFKRTFCSWICPIGTLSEGLGKIGRTIFGRNFQLPGWLDYILRSLKYLLLLLFLVAIFWGMSGTDAVSFVQSPYNRMSDVMMLEFMEHLSVTGISVIGILALLTIVFENFWCRYLCPYGALLGLFSFLSPFKITRNQETCIQCGKCTKSCPNRITVDLQTRVFSPECTGCLNCVQQCPVQNTLRFKVARGKKILSLPYLTLVILSLWFLVIVFAKATGHWGSNMTLETYKQLLLMI